MTTLDHAPAVLDSLTVEMRTRLLSYLAPDLQLRVLTHLRVAAPEDSVDLATTTIDDISTLANELSAACEIPRAASLIRRWLDETENNTHLPLALRPIIDAWIARANDQTALTDTIALLASARSATAHYSPTHRALRQTRKTILERMKIIVAAGDGVALEHLAAEVAQFPIALPELALARARFKFVAGDYGRVLQLGRDVVSSWEDNISVWVLMMRAAAKLNDDVGTSVAAKRVMALSDPSTQRLEAEAQDHLRQIEVA